MMSSLLTWRNPQGSEEGWYRRSAERHAEIHDIGNRWEHYGKVIATEIGLVIPLLIAEVEVCAYAALTVISLVFYPITDRPYQFSAKLLDSACFSFVWIAGMATYNLVQHNRNVWTHESFVRLNIVDDVGEHFFPFRLLREEDMTYVNHWQAECARGGNTDPLNNLLDNPARSRPLPADLFAEARRLLAEAHRERLLAVARLETATLLLDNPLSDSELSDSEHLEGLPVGQAEESVINLRGLAIDQGATFLVDEVLYGVTSATKELFKEQDPDTDIYMFILTRAAFIYTWGPRQNDEIPAFFKRQVQELIKVYRSNEVVRGLDLALADLTTFNVAAQAFTNRAVLSNAFEILRNIAAIEQEGGGLLIQECWEKAKKKLSLAGIT